jgi:putative transposase
MPNSCVMVYVHYVWATWDRKPLITPELEPRLYAAIAAECRSVKCVPDEIGGTEDHVHVLLRLHQTVTIAQAAQAMKGGSSHLSTHRLEAEQFKWQGAYGAFGVSQERLDRVRNYIRQQKEHHRNNDLEPEWERCFDLEDAPGSPRRRAS